MEENIFKRLEKDHIDYQRDQFASKLAALILLPLLVFGGCSACVSAIIDGDKPTNDSDVATIEGHGFDEESPAPTHNQRVVKSIANQSKKEKKIEMGKNQSPILD